MQTLAHSLALCTHTHLETRRTYVLNTQRHTWTATRTRPHPPGTCSSHANRARPTQVSKTTGRCTHMTVPTACLEIPRVCLHVSTGTPTCPHAHARTHARCRASELPGPCPSLIPALNPRVWGAQARGAAGHLASLAVIKARAGAGGRGTRSFVFCLTSRDTANSNLGFLRRFCYMTFTEPWEQTSWGGGRWAWLCVP